MAASLGLHALLVWQVGHARETASASALVPLLITVSVQAREHGDGRPAPTRLTAPPPLGQDATPKVARAPRQGSTKSAGERRGRDESPAPVRASREASTRSPASAGQRAPATNAPPRRSDEPSAAPREAAPQPPDRARHGAEPTAQAHERAPSGATSRPRDLSPRTAARTLIQEESPPRVDTAARSANAVEPAPSAPTNASVATSLRPTVAEPESDQGPVLRKRPDGSYGFRGTGFNATIRKDGSVEMSDKYGSFAPPFVPVELPDGSWTMTLGGVAFDLMALLERAFGNDPYRSERLWFFAGTRALRERLAEEAAAQGMRAQLLRLWSDARLTFAERKERTFSLWDECSEDAHGQRGRAIVERFVRERCPEHDMRGFSAAELDALNAGRRSRARFLPYESEAH